MASALPYFLAYFLAIAHGCTPGAGELTAKPTFTFDIKPPVAWTYNAEDTRVPKQHEDADQAKAQINIDVKAAINMALAVEGMASSSVVSTTINFTPLNAVLITPCTAVANTYLNDGSKTVSQKCTGDRTQDDVSDTGTVVIESSLPIALSEWESLATNVESMLESKGVVFNKEVTVTA